MTYVFKTHTIIWHRKHNVFIMSRTIILFLKMHKQWRFAPQVSSLLLFTTGSPPRSRSTHRLLFKESNGAQELLCQSGSWEQTVLLAHLTLMMMEWQHCCRSLHINKEANQTEMRINAYTFLVVLPVGLWLACSCIGEHLSDKVILYWWSLVVAKS